MTTTDPFTEAMFAASRENNPHRDPQFGEFRDGAEWARTYLATQEPTNAECVAVLNVKYGGHVGPDDEPYDEEDMAEARAALSAARAARRDRSQR